MHVLRVNNTYSILNYITVIVPSRRVHSFYSVLFSWLGLLQPILQHVYVYVVIGQFIVLVVLGHLVDFRLTRLSALI